jgi:hypothetical protein
MYQLTELAADRHRQQPAAAKAQHPAGRALALARATRRAERQARQLRAQLQTQTTPASDRRPPPATPAPTTTRRSP